VSTIHYRLNNLREDGVIENDLYDLDHEALGLGVTVIVEVLADYEGPYEEFAEELLAVEGVTEAFFTMGETDFVVPRGSPRRTPSSASSATSRRSRRSSARTRRSRSPPFATSRARRRRTTSTR